jgi:hypothetical protein
MKISACTIIKNATKFSYPIIESINSLLPFTDEYIINIGNSEDDTKELLIKEFGNNSKVIMFDSIWEGKEQGMAFFRNQTNLSLKKCKKDWIFYLQGDEAVHEDDMKKLKYELEIAEKNNKKAIMFNFLHFEKDYRHTKKGYSEGFDAYEEEIRIIKNNEGIFSHGDAMGFAYQNYDLKALPQFIHKVDFNIYHYGYVKEEETMLEKKLYLKEFYFSDPSFTNEQRQIENGKIRSKNGKYIFSKQVNEFNGTHPSSMKNKIELFEEKLKKIN